MPPTIPTLINPSNPPPTHSTHSSLTIMSIPTGGDIKFLRLAQRRVGGLVTDGSVRDTNELLGYGFPVFSFSTTANQGPAAMQPWAVNDVIACGTTSSSKPLVYWSVRLDARLAKAKAGGAGWGPGGM